jgi:ATP-dependent exoDNAse (exonuclease V) alpha subunit
MEALMLRVRHCVGDASEEVRHPVAIYHLTAKVISREKGRSAVAAAAYRAGESLYDERLGQTFDYTRKQGVHHTEILAPKDAPDWIDNRERLWNVVEACEKRKDAQLAREIEIGLPRELDAEAQIALLRDFVQREFVNKGMVADFSLHRDNLENPHAHILLTFRRISANGFGLKERSWNARSNLEMWRAGWMEVANEHLARAGLDIRIDHRTLKAQEIDLIPGRKIGVSLDRQQDPALPRRIAERVEEQRRIAQLNGESILSDPTIALRALTHQQATFTKHDIARFLNTRTDGADQFRTALLKVTASPELVALGHDDRGQQRYTTREMLDLEEGMLHRTELMTLRAGHGTAIGQAGAAELNTVMRQNYGWQREATQEFAKGATTRALAAYAAHSAIVHSQTRVSARSTLVTLWAHDGKLRPEESRLMLAYTRDDVHQLNELAREVRRECGELGYTENIETERGTRQFAVGDRLYFLRNEKSLGVKNGSLGTVELVNNGVLQVRLDRTKASVSVDTRFYRDLDHGYAATVYKAQGVAVDRSYVLATPHFDRHSTYVALSRHRETATMFYAVEDFAGHLAQNRMAHKEIHDEFAAALSRARPKDLAHDYLEPSPEGDLTQTQPSYERRDVHIPMDQIDAQQQAAAERWREKQREQELHDTTPEQDHSADLNEPLELSEDDPLTRNSRHELSRDGVEDDLEL